MSGPLKRAEYPPAHRLLGTRKAEDLPPADPHTEAVRESLPVVPAPRIYWARTQPLEHLAVLLACHFEHEACPHQGARHCQVCMAGHLDDVILHLLGERDPYSS